MELQVIKLLDELAKTQGTNAKKAFLKEQENNIEFKEALKFILDTEIVTSGISEKKLAKNVKEVGFEGNFLDLLSYISENNTGKDEHVGRVKYFANKYDEQTRQGIFNVIAQRWTGLGVNRSSANAVYGSNFISKFEVILAEKYEDNVEAYKGKKYHIQDKLDGFRTIAIKENGKVTLWSRNGKKKEGFVDIERALESAQKDNIVLDSELQPEGYNDMDSAEAYKKTSNSSKKGEKTGMCLVVYDMLSLEEWKAKSSSKTYDERYTEYREFVQELDSPYIIGLETLTVTEDTDDIKKYLKVATDAKREGIILKMCDGLYKWDRCNEIVKVKVFQDIDVAIEGFELGTGKNKEVAGALLFSYKGNQVKVGSGLTDELRKDIVANFETKYKGQIMEVVYFEESQDSNGKVSLRFPTYKGLKKDER